MVCNFEIQEPTTLKEALELLDVMHKSVNGSKQGVRTVFDNKLGDKSTAAFNNLHSALGNASELRARIVGYDRVYNYGSYGKLRNSGDDKACGFRIIAILQNVLPKLITTLAFLLKKVESKTDDGWGMQTCNGRNSGMFISGRKDLYEWLTLQNPTAGSQLAGGYRAYEPVGSTGDQLSNSLKLLVKNHSRGLHQLNEDIKGINVTRNGLRVPNDQRKIPHSVPQPQLNESPPNGNNSYGHYNEGSHSQRSSTQRSPAYRRSPSPGPQDHHAQRHQPQFPPVEPPAETLPSPAGGSSSTAAIGGAVGATSLVGGGATVYFLNIGGIRTLIAG
ncbi:ribosome-binding protein 1, putative [Babesia caballi]|uniref:Ribosome-binding protein 1, putative n=1 Tax=Babesia caballi TaxID=5871 RepID=A0AAV4LZA5_BABCB|nr:ribosome-binding protein 1, putative [Babesia caballi]